MNGAVVNAASPECVLTTWQVTRSGACRFSLDEEGME